MTMTAREREREREREEEERQALSYLFFLKKCFISVITSLYIWSLAEVF